MADRLTTNAIYVDVDGKMGTVGLMRGFDTPGDKTCTYTLGPPPGR